MDARALARQGYSVRRDRPAAGSGLADGQALSGDRRAAGLPAQADAVDVGRVQAADRSVAGGHAGAVGDPDPSGPGPRLRRSRAATTRSGATSSVPGRGRRRGQSERFETRPGHQAQVDWSHEEPIKTSPRGSSCRSIAFTWSSATPETRSARSRAPRTWSPSGPVTGRRSRISAASRASCSMTAPRPSSARTSAANGAWARTCSIPRRWPRRITTGSRCGSARPTGPRPRARSSPTSPTSANGCCAPTRFASYEHANREWASWNEDIARRRVHGTHGEVVAVRAERDRAALGPLPPTPYLVVERTTRVVARDGLFSFEGRRYAVPDARPGERVELVLGAARARGLLHRRRAPARAPPTRPPSEGAPGPGRAVGVAGAGARRAPRARGPSPSAVGLPAAHRWLS